MLISGKETTSYWAIPVLTAGRPFESNVIQVFSEAVFIRSRT